MSRPRTIDHGAVLDLWSLGVPGPQIHARLGIPGRTSVRKIAARARSHGDRRALSRVGQQYAVTVLVSETVLECISQRAARTGQKPVEVMAEALARVFGGLERAVFDDEPEGASDTIDWRPTA